MKCSECKFLKISNFMFDDNTKSIECIRVGKFLGFTTTRGQVLDEVLKTINCDRKEIVVNEPVKVVTELPVKRISGITGITWNDRTKVWQVRAYCNKKKKQAYIGASPDLKLAKKLLKDWEASLK